jgi:hypothetical protein
MGCEWPIVSESFDCHDLPAGPQRLNDASGIDGAAKMILVRSQWRAWPEAIFLCSHVLFRA